MRSSTDSARPSYLTPRNRDALSYGPAAARMAQALRRPLMPWQRDYLDLAGELTPDGTRLAHPYVVVVVPRRAGKTAGMLAAMLQRCALGPTRNIYTAQTRTDAAKAMREDWVPMLDAGRLTPTRVKVRRSQGSESLTWTRTGGTLSLFAPTEQAVHGQDVDAAVVDEAWSFDTAQGDAIEAAIQPAQATRDAHRQTWIVSAGGTPSSSWLARWVDLGRSGDPAVALVEYGADAEHDDLDDPAVWARVHPAVGHTITLDTLAGIRATMNRAEFDRAFLGVWTHDYGVPPKLPPQLWEQAADPAAAPTSGVAYGLEVASDASSATIAAAGRWVDADQVERIAVLVVEHQGGTAWVPDAWRAIRARAPGRLYADALGPTVATVEALGRARMPVEVLTTGHYTAACQGLLDDLVAGVLAHRTQPVLDAAARTATARAIGDRWVWNRRGRADAAPLIAATLAAHGARRPTRRPFVRVAT